MYSKRSVQLTLCKTALLLVLNCQLVFSEQIVIKSNEVGVTSGKQQQQTSFTATSSNAAHVPSLKLPVNPGNTEEQYRATYFYPAPHPHPVNWNRDSYADAATDFGYNQQQQQQTQQTASSFGSAVYAPAYGDSSEGYDDSFGSGLGGLGGVAGILGLKGIKGLGILALAKAASPLLLLIIPALLLLPLLLLFFPVPVITVPATSRSFMSTFNFGDISGKMTNLARSVIDSDKCMERISCEISRVSRGSFIDKTLKRVIPRFEPRMPQTLKRIARVYLEGQTSCSKKYTCYLMDDSSGGATKNKTN